MAKELTSGMICGWRKSSLIDQTTDDLNTQIKETTIVSYFIKNIKIWNKI